MRYTGIVTGNELLRSNFDLYKDPRFKEIKYGILDFLNVEKVEFYLMDVKEVAYADAQAAKINPFVKVAVVTATPLLTGYSNLYSKYVDESVWETQSFMTIDDARKWIATNL